MTQQHIEDIEYFEVETDTRVDELINNFIKKWLPESYAHLVDTDENDGQRLRVQLSALLGETKEKL